MSTETTEPAMVTVRRDDLDIVVAACTSYLPQDADRSVSDAFGRLLEAFDEAHGIEGEMPGPEPSADDRPPGFWGRVELPGWRNHTGWITDELVFGTQLCVVRDWDGNVKAMVGIGPACQVLPLPTPLKRPGPAAAITAGEEGEDGEPAGAWGEESF